MNKRAILLLIGLLITSSFVFCQVSKDTLKENPVFPQFFYGNISAEENWQIHKEAYKRQLETKGLSENEIEKRMQEYEKQKAEFIIQYEEQRKLAEKQRQLAEIQRQKANEQQKLAETQRQEAETQRQLADIQREKANEQRKQAEIQRKEANKQRELAEIQRKNAEEQRELAEIQRLKAEEQRRIAEEYRKSIKELLNKNIGLTSENSKAGIINLKINNDGALFFNINGYLNSGNVLVEIINPSGKKEGELSLEYSKGNTSGNSFTTNSSGSLNKTVNKPESGEWKIKIIPKNAKGSVNILVAQYINPDIEDKND